MFLTLDETKPRGNISIEGMFEALAHRQYTTRPYVIFHIGGKDFENEPEKNRIEALAEQNGMGLILAENPEDYETSVESVRAKRWLPDPQDLNDFIGRIFPAIDHDEIIKLTKWIDHGGNGG